MLTITLLQASGPSNLHIISRALTPADDLSPSPPPVFAPTRLTHKAQLPLQKHWRSTPPCRSSGMLPHTTDPNRYDPLTLTPLPYSVWGGVASKMTPPSTSLRAWPRIKASPRSSAPCHCPPQLLSPPANSACLCSVLVCSLSYNRICGSDGDQMSGLTALCEMLKTNGSLREIKCAA